MISEQSELNHWVVYILKCKNEILYTGITDNLDRRYKEHLSGKGGWFTKCNPPISLIYSEKVASKNAALSREKQIKGWTKAKKLALAQKDFAALKKL